MNLKSFSIVFCVAAAAAMGLASATPLPSGDSGATGANDVVLVQSFKERTLDDLPAVDAGRTQPRTAPPPPPVPPVPRITSRNAPPSVDDESGPPPREVPPPPSLSRTTPPPPPGRTPTRVHESAPRPAPATRAAPIDDEPPPPRRAEPRPRLDDPPAPRRAQPTRPPVRSAFSTNCTQQCHLSCEASFEACNGDSSPAKVSCVKKLESCRVERCACRIE